MNSLAAKHGITTQKIGQREHVRVEIASTSSSRGVLETVSDYSARDHALRARAPKESSAPRISVACQCRLRRPVLDWTGLDEDASVDEFLNGCISGRLTHTEFRSDKGNGHDGLA